MASILGRAKIKQQILDRLFREKNLEVVPSNGNENSGYHFPAGLNSQRVWALM
jgi:hypothetical protein